ncbi:DUF4386 domain-containing protein [Mycetocola sp.]|uniref:DUF4386 domain-containing protein n=1 Tax=Mycetocola sp. TaxID=1871042 RepID=UPI003989BC54
MDQTTLDSQRATVRQHPRSFTEWPQRKGALVAGVGLALMAGVAGFANFGAIAPLITRGDAVQTAQDISASPVLFWSGVVGFVIVALLDIVVAGALYVVFRPVSRRLSAVAGWVRAIYGVLLAVCVSQLVIGFSLLDDPEAALPVLESFSTFWVIIQGLLFGVSLILVGYLAFRADFMAKVFGILLALAGLSYLADGIGTIFDPDFAIFAQFLFAGEVVLIFWLLIRGRRLPA